MVRSVNRVFGSVRECPLVMGVQADCLGWRIALVPIWSPTGQLS